VQGQADYLHFLAGFALLLAGVSAMVLARLRPSGPRWARLAAFAMVLAAVKWLGVFATSEAGSRLLPTASHVAQACAWLLLFSFVPRQSVAGPPALRRWLAPPLGVLALCMTLSPDSGRRPPWELALVLLAGLPAVWELSRCRVGQPPRRLGLRLASWSLLAFVIEEAWLGQATPRYDEPTLGEAVAVVTSSLLAVGLWLGYEEARRHQLQGRPVRDRGWATPLLAAGLALVLAVGWLHTEQAGRETTQRERDQMLRSTVAGALAIDPERVVRFVDAPGRDAPDYAPLRQTLQQLRATDPAFRFVYLMAEREGRMIFLVDAEDERSPDYSPPGQVYDEAAEQFDVVRERRAMVIGPVTDRWGTWITAMAPIVDPRTGQALALLGQDVDAVVWMTEVVEARRAAMMAVLVSALLLALLLLVQQPADAAADRRRTMAGIVDQGPVVLWCWRVDGDSWPVELVSENVADVLGYPAADFLAGRVTWLAMVHPDDRPRVEAEAARCLRDGAASWSQEYRVLTRAGQVRTIQVWHRVVVGPGGTAAFVNALALDITDAREAAAALERGDRILTAVAGFAEALLSGERWTESLARELPRLTTPTGANSAMLAQFQTGEDGVVRASWVTEWASLGLPVRQDDPAFHEAGVAAAGFGRWLATLQAGQPVAGNVEDFAEPERSELLRREVTSVAVLPVTVGSACWGALVIGTADARLAWSEAELAALQTGASLIGAAIARQAIEAELAGTEARWTAMVDAMDEMVVTHRLSRDETGAVVDYRLVDVNLAFTRITGLPAEQAAGALASELFGTADAPYLEIYRTVAQTGLPDQFESYFAPLEKHFSITAVPLGEDGFATITSDVTSLKQARAERQHLEQQMQHVQRLESLGVLAGGIAHDFNNLLTSILGNAELALTDLPDGAPSRSSLEAIVEASRRAAELCTQMLACAGKGRFVVEPVNLTALVQAMTHIIEVSLAERGVIRYLLEADLPAVDADPAQLRQVLLNLVVNAAEAIGEHSGVVSIRTGAMDCDQGYLAATWISEPLSEGQFVFVEVSDTGIGMDRETLSRIFEPFFTTKFTAAASASLPRWGSSPPTMARSRSTVSRVKVRPSACCSRPRPRRRPPPTPLPGRGAAAAPCCWSTMRDPSLGRPADARTPRLRGPDRRRRPRCAGTLSPARRVHPLRAA